MKANTNITLKNRSVAVLNNFKGVDFSSSQLEIKPYRASFMRNMISEYGVNHKRNGWEQLVNLVDSKGEPASINGIFEYKNDDYRCWIVHAGDKFYRMNKDGISNHFSIVDMMVPNIYYDDEHCECEITSASISNTKSQSFYNNGRLYIITGFGIFVYGTWDNGKTYLMKSLYDCEDTYIPLTTADINAEGVTENTKYTIDDINMLSSWRRNTFRGVDSDSASWVVDSGVINEYSKVSIIADIYIKSIKRTVCIYNDFDTYLSWTRLHLKTIDEGSEYYKTDVGTIDFENGMITLNINTNPPLAEKANMEITFQPYLPEAMSDRIDMCTIGTIFGVNGANDRLFLSGNKNYRNIEYFSEIDDWSYFPVKNQVVVGNDFSAIKGFSRLADSTLVIYKGNNSIEPSIYYQTGEYITEYFGDNSLKRILPKFSVKSGALSEELASCFSTQNFAGDCLMLSNNGLFSIVTTQNISITERQLRERSRMINAKLLKHKNLSEAVSIVYKNKYYLAIDGVCYVADAGYRVNLDDDLDDTYSYEWWYFDNVPIRCFCVIDGELFFGTNDGRICRFYDGFCDITMEKCSFGDLSVNSVDNIINFNKNMKYIPKENDIIVFPTKYGKDFEYKTIDGLYRLICEKPIKVEDNRIYIADEDISKIYDGQKVYIDKIDLSGLSVNTEYKITNIDRGNNSFQLTLNGSIITIYNNSFRISQKINSTEYSGEYNRRYDLQELIFYITNVGTSSFQIKEGINGSIVKFISYNGKTPTNLIADFFQINNVISEWYTPIMSFGTNQASKTITKITIATEPSTNGEIIFGYETKNIEQSFNKSNVFNVSKIEKNINSKGLNIFDFNNLSFEDFSFDTGFASSYTIKTNIRNFNYIIFRFLSNTNSDCAVNSLSILYKVNKYNKGVN